MQPVTERLPNSQTPELNRELRVATDTATWLAETLHGSMRTDFEFSFADGELRGEDGGLLDEIFDDAIAEARQMTEWNPSMLFELRRRLTERDELDDMYGMASGELPNTMIVVSDFPAELMDANEDEGGYNVDRKQTMMRIITSGEDGSINITSLSLDGSNRQALEAMYEAMGEPVEEGELLGQRIHRDLPPQWQDRLANNLRQVYDRSMAEQFGGEWHAGISQRPDRNIMNTYEFVRGQQDILEWYTRLQLEDPAKAKQYRYQVAATAKSRHERYLKAYNGHAEIVDHEPVHHKSVITASSVAAARGLEYELAYEGRRAAEAGMVFSGCGETVTAGDEAEAGPSSVIRLSELGYGNRDDHKSEKGVMRCVNCPECRTYHEEIRAKNGVFRCKNSECGYTAKAKS